MCHRLGEAKDDHQRLLRLAEEQYRSRLSELQEEKDLVLEEKELRCQSLITQHQNNQQGIQVTEQCLLYFKNLIFLIF